jgi:D-arginine dehydrogenase
MSESEKNSFDVIIVGGGIAGISLAYFLVERGVTDLLIVEKEEQPAYHATGRSAAVVLEFNENPVLHRLIVAGAPFCRRPPPGFCEDPLLEQAGGILLGQGEGWDLLQKLAPMMQAEGVVVQPLSRDEVIDRVPVLDKRSVDGALLLPEDGHLDVHGLLYGYLRRVTRAGGELRCNVEVTGVLREGGRCVGIRTASSGELRARWVVNAAGAWVGEVGRLAEATPIVFQPRRRTVITFEPPADLEQAVRSWPMVDHYLRELYFKPESGALMASPMDQIPSPPCDARPDELQIAEAVDRLEQIAPPLVPRTIKHKWAGLRTFSPDEVPVVGEDPRVEGFFWLAGQGGCGIETSPILGAIAADLLVDGSTDRFDHQLLSPVRLG